jgi:lipopolysaccharide transport system ATP-binding protein
MGYAKGRREQISAAQKRSTKGGLPDFVVIGTQKGGTSFFYRLLSNHPLVRPAATKELHFFDRNKVFDRGEDWYRRCFPESARVGGQRTVTGESSPSYLFSAQVPARMAEVIPDAKLVALLRNPIDRAYSHYQMQVRRGTEERSFEEATKEEMDTGGGPPYLARGFYAEQPERFSFFADRGQLLVVNSENLFARPLEVLQRVFRFLELPPWWEPTVARPADGETYEPMEPATRRRLEEFFAPHSERLYDLLRTDFGW